MGHERTEHERGSDGSSERFSMFGRKSSPKATEAAEFEPENYMAATAIKICMVDSGKAPYGATLVGWTGRSSVTAMVTGSGQSVRFEHTGKIKYIRKH